MPRVPRRPLRGALTAPDCPSYPHLDSALRYRARLPQQPSSTRQTDCQDHRSRRHRHRPSRHRPSRRRSSHQPNRPPNRRPSSRPPQRRSNNRPSRPRSRRPVKHQSRSPHRRRLRRPPPSSAEDPDGAPTKPPGQHTAPCRSHRSHSPSHRSAPLPAAHASKEPPQAPWRDEWFATKAIVSWGTHRTNPSAGDIGIVPVRLPAGRGRAFEFVQLRALVDPLKPCT